MESILDLVMSSPDFVFENDEKFVDLIKSCPNQELFMSSFKGIEESTKSVDLDDVWQWMGFTKKSNAKRALKSIFTEEHYNITYGNNIGTKHETITMSADTFKKFCMRAGTKRCNEICDYYLSLEKIVNKYMHNLIQKKTLETESRIEEERHKIIVRANANVPVVYIMKIKDMENGSFIIKIGHTNDLQSRWSKICSHFGLRVHVREAYVCEMNIEFENFLHNHKYLQEFKYNEAINNGIKSVECYLMKSAEDLEHIKRIVKRNIVFFKTRNVSNVEHQMQLLKMEHEEKINNGQLELLKAFKTPEDLEKFQKIASALMK